MNNFEYPSLIEKDNDNFDFLSSFVNVETPRDNDLFEDLFENEEEVKIDIDNEDYCQEEQFIHSFNKYNDSLNANYILSNFDSPDMIESPPNNINNMHSLHEDKIIMNVDRQIKNNHMAENNDINNDIKENLNWDVAIFTSSNSSSFIYPTVPNTPVKKEQISKESIKKLTKRKISKSNSKILKKKDSDVPPKRVNMRELKCKRKLEETKGKLQFPLNLARIHFFYDLDLISTKNMEFMHNKIFL